MLWHCNNCLLTAIVGLFVTVIIFEKCLGVGLAVLKRVSGAEFMWTQCINVYLY
jgi:hypothetical protein